MKEHDEQITLCDRCISNYLEAGERIYKDRSVETKDKCDICDIRLGWTYIIDRSKKKDKHE